MLRLLAFQLAVTTPSSPGSSPQHWTTKSFAAAGIVALLIFAIAFFSRSRLKNAIRDSVPFRVTLFASAPARAVAISIIGSVFDVFRRGTYIPTAEYQPDWHVVFWLCIWSALSTYVLTVTWFIISAKEGEGFRSKQLEADLSAEKTASKSFEKQRDLLVRITSFARQAVMRKTDRVGNVDIEAITVEEFFVRLNPGWQLQFLLKMIYEFFKPQDPTVNFRLGLWTRVGDYLAPVYSWNGESSECFSGRSQEYMRVLNVSGPSSEVSKCYLGNNENLRIIPDCADAVSKGEFEYFYLGQASNIRSMILYKYSFMRLREPIAVVVLLVSSQPNHFLVYGQEIKQFLNEILMRIEMEWVMLSIKEKLAPLGRGTQ